MISPSWPEIKDVKAAIDPTTTDDGWFVPNPPPNPKDDWGSRDRDEPPPSVGTAFAV